MTFHTLPRHEALNISHCGANALAKQCATTGFVFSLQRRPDLSSSLRRDGLHACRRRQRTLSTTGYVRLPVTSTTGEPATTSPAGAIYDDDGSRTVPIPLFIEGTKNQTVAGVYGVMDQDRELVYVGMSRDVAASLSVHWETHDDQTFYVKVMTFRLPMVLEMKRVVESWILENEVIPVGNVESWYEADEELAKQADAVSTDAPQTGPIISPFESDPLANEEAVETMEFTASNVDLVLDKVRPYLISDGGNVSVESVNLESGRVALLLEGACGSCSSATTTMQMGIEKALREHFGDSISEVVAVNVQESSDEPSILACERALDTIRATLRGLGGEVSVVEVDEDEAVVSFTGPNNLKYGIEQLLVQKVAGVEIVTFE